MRIRGHADFSSAVTGEALLISDEKPTFAGGTYRLNVLKYLFHTERDALALCLSVYDELQALENCLVQRICCEDTTFTGTITIVRMHTSPSHTPFAQDRFEKEAWTPPHSSLFFHEIISSSIVHLMSQESSTTRLTCHLSWRFWSTGQTYSPRLACHRTAPGCTRSSSVPFRRPAH